MQPAVTGSLSPCPGRLPDKRPEGSLALATHLDPGVGDPRSAGWALGRYRFDRYGRTGPDRAPAVLEAPEAPTSVRAQAAEADALHAT